jgi:lysyl-tRNA synthetase class 2
MQNQSSDLAGQRQQRINNLNKLRGIGINPYPSISQKDFSNKEIKDNFTKFENKTVILAGRLIAKREHGKLIFGDLQDASDTIQLAIKKDEIETDLKNGFLGWIELKLIDVSDFVQVKGTISKTQQGEVTLFVKKLTLLSKSLRPMPTQIDDKEQQFRRRYVDLAINSKKKDLFVRKSKFWEASREFMKENGFMEVETPVLEHVTGGADATPFMTHHNALDQDFYLRISTELYQKRLIGGGFEKIFTLGPNFRNEGLSDEHLQEFYQLEWYFAYADYKDNMNLVKNLFRYIAKEVYGKTKFQTRGHSFDLSDDWEEISYP